jgi:AcrR family transcriptional regulator
MAEAAPHPPETGDTRQRLLDVAIDLISRHGFAGTSLQMIADELGFTKAAIYYHFRSREQLLTAVLEPIFGRLQSVVEAAESLRTPRARAERMVSGFAALAARNRAVVPVLAGDPSVIEMVHSRPDWAELITRQMALLSDVEPGPAGPVRAAVVFSGLAGAASPVLSGIDDDTLSEYLADAGRRLLGLRIPRHPKDVPERTTHAE